MFIVNNSSSEKNTKKLKGTPQITLPEITVVIGRGPSFQILEDIVESTDVLNVIQLS